MDQGLDGSSYRPRAGGLTLGGSEAGSGPAVIDGGRDAGAVQEQMVDLVL